MNDNALVQLSAARHALTECRTVMEAKQISDVAEAARVYLERTNASVATVNQAAEIRTLAERQMGAFLQKMPLNPGRPAKHNGSGEEPLPDPTLAQIGITKKQSFQAQRLAAIPEPEFQKRMETIKAVGDRLTPSKVLNGGATRRSPTRFDSDSWRRHAEATIKAWLKAVPSQHREDAADFLAQTAREVLAQL